MKRKDFIEKSIRIGLFAILALMVGLLFRRNAISYKTASCQPDLCANCQKASRCSDSQAIGEEVSK